MNAFSAERDSSDLGTPRFSSEILIHSLLWRRSSLMGPLQQIKLPCLI
jgi:hypothetical protein